MQKDATEYARKCEKCEKHAPLIHQPARPYESDQQPLALRTMGAGYSWPISLYHGQSKVCFSGY